MEKTLLIIAGLFAFSILIYIIKTRNYFKFQRQEVEAARSGIEIALTNRYDTLVKLNATVKGYAGHESSVLENVTKLRKGMSGEELSAVNNELGAALSQINALAENYPELKANENFMHLQDAIYDLENTLQATRRKYNLEVSELNKKIQGFPSNIIANFMNEKTESYFEAEEHKKQDYSIEF